ncbi:hypothetical protein PPACK8108_LOCUS9626 [Phakopsora pachyrhizi]|uniref:DDE-1 domain-containing protein n=1 Tax=Phakopsora pachyrhizi TaxID=170000 RepID=A0AAV0AWS6_PHAPC|nr:hypothetical protein PPACK8108_LOCUS9626 [Phakopsora pachyrhizi]
MSIIARLTILVTIEAERPNEIQIKFSESNRIRKFKRFWKLKIDYGVHQMDQMLEKEYLCFVWLAIGNLSNLNTFQTVERWNKTTIGRFYQPKNLTELTEAIHKAWSEIPPQILENLVASMPGQMAEVIVSKGGHTHY